LANGRHEQIPQESENVRQSESVLQAVDVSDPALGCDAPGAATASAMGVEGAPGSVTGGGNGAVEGAGEGLRSLRLQARASSIEKAAPATIDLDATAGSANVRPDAARTRNTDMAGSIPIGPYAGQRNGEGALSASEHVWVASRTRSQRHRAELQSARPRPSADLRPGKPAEM
jgi:hypothetical protein